MMPIMNRQIRLKSRPDGMPTPRNFETVDAAVPTPGDGEVLRETLRESDVAGRWGGEEFLLLLPGADEEGAAQLAERVRVVLAARSIPSVPGLRVTASFGVAEYAGETTPEQLLEAADGALYRAKRAGKDRVERAARAAF